MLILGPAREVVIDRVQTSHQFVRSLSKNRTDTISEIGTRSNPKTGPEPYHTYLKPLRIELILDNYMALTQRVQTRQPAVFALTDLLKSRIRTKQEVTTLHFLLQVTNSATENHIHVSEVYQ